VDAGTAIRPDRRCCRVPKEFCRFSSTGTPLNTLRTRLWTFLGEDLWALTGYRNCAFLDHLYPIDALNFPFWQFQIYRIYRTQHSPASHISSHLVSSGLVRFRSFSLIFGPVTSPAVCSFNHANRRGYIYAQARGAVMLARVPTCDTPWRYILSCWRSGGSLKPIPTVHTYHPIHNCRRSRAALVEYVYLHSCTRKSKSWQMELWLFDQAIPMVVTTSSACTC
jgi:hypothetical protein